MTDRSKKTRDFIAVVIREGEEYVAICPDLDLSAQGLTAEDAKANLRSIIEALLVSDDCCKPRRMLN